MNFQYTSTQRDAILFYPDTGRRILEAIEHATRQAGGGHIKITTRLILDHVNVSRNCVTTWLKRLQKDSIIALRITPKCKIYQVTLKYLPIETGINLESNWNNSGIFCNQSGIIDPVLYSKYIYKNKAEEIELSQASTIVESTSQNHSFIASGRKEIKTKNESSEPSSISDEEGKSLKVFEKGKTMADEILDLCRIYSQYGNKYKSKIFKGKSAQSLSKNYGERLGEIIQEFGEDATRDGLKEFMHDEYWQKNGLPLFAFMKHPHKWIQENAPGDAGDAGGVLGASDDLPARPAARKAANRPYVAPVAEVDPAPEPVNWGRKRAIRRNEICEILRMGGAPEVAQELIDRFDSLDDSGIESYFELALAAFQKKMNRRPPVTSVPLV